MRIHMYQIEGGHLIAANKNWMSAIVECILIQFTCDWPYLQVSRVLNVEKAWNWCKKWKAVQAAPENILWRYNNEMWGSLYKLTRSGSVENDSSMLNCESNSNNVHGWWILIWPKIRKYEPMWPFQLLDRAISNAETKVSFLEVHSFLTCWRKKPVAFRKQCWCNIILLTMHPAIPAETGWSLKITK